MTVKEAIEQADSMRPNMCEDAQKCTWLTELDGRVIAEIFDAHEGFEGISRPAYVIGNRLEEMLAPDPYSVMYIYWIFMKIDFMNGEFDRFNNDAIMFNTAWLSFSNHINRTHAPKKRAKIENV
ncbi:MAG: hypothetical protein IKJ65_05640 [Clostridia bacterium]|nr:hypothetical protein [Clostridia bacterium]